MTRAVTTQALASTALTASGTVDLGQLPNDYDSLNVFIAVSAVSGTSPSMTVTYQGSHDGTTWYNGAATSAITAAGNTLLSIASVFGKYGRLSYAITGTTPSLTTSINTEARRNWP